MNNHTLTLRPFADADIALLDGWLHQDYVRRWYHDPEDWLAEVRGRHSEYAWIHHFIVMDGGAPIGFCQYYDCYDAGGMEDWYTVAAPGEAYSIDYMIGDARCLGKAIVALVTQAVRATGQAQRIIVQPDADNHASNGVLLANGYVFDAEKGYYWLGL